MPQDSLKKNVMDIVALWTYIAIAYLISFLMLFAFRGAEDINIISKTYLYYPMGIIFGIAITINQLVSKFNKKTIFQSYIHDPEEKGTKDISKFKFIKSGWYLSALSFSFFGFIFLISGATKKFLTALPELQVSEIAHITYAVEPANLGENLGIVFVLGLVYGIAKKYSKDKFQFILYMALGIIFVAIMFYAWHLFRYGADQTSLIGVLIFGLSASLLTVMTASLIPISFYHGTNNLFQAIGVYFSSDLYLLISIGIYIIISIILWLFAIRFGRKSPS